MGFKRTQLQKCLLTSSCVISADVQKFSLLEAAAQAFVFFAAGFETSSTTMMFALYELALNPEVQDKLRDDITTVLSQHNNQITYDSIQEMSYLDRVVAGKLHM